MANFTDFSGPRPILEFNEDKSGYDRTFDGLEGLPEYPKRITIHPRWWIDPIPELSAYGEKHAKMVLMAEVQRLASMTDADF